MTDFVQDWQKARELILFRDFEALKSLPLTFNLDMSVNEMNPLICYCVGSDEIDIKMTRYLLEKGARPDPRVKNSGDPISVCVKYGYPECLELLLKSYCDRLNWNWQHMQKLPHDLVEGFGKSSKLQRKLQKILDRYDYKTLKQQDDIRRLAASIPSHNAPRLKRRPKL